MSDERTEFPDNEYGATDQLQEQLTYQVVMYLPLTELEIRLQFRNLIVIHTIHMLIITI
ncbi:MAG: hypothetical protein WAX04_00425 [Oscillospiraceae bacterium]